MPTMSRREVQAMRDAQHAYAQLEVMREKRRALEAAIRRHHREMNGTIAFADERLWSSVDLCPIPSERPLSIRHLRRLAA